MPQPNRSLIGLGGAGMAIVTSGRATRQNPCRAVLLSTEKSPCLCAFSQQWMLIGEKALAGRGAGRLSENGRAAVDESWDTISKALIGSPSILIAAGAAGGTGGAAPYLAKKFLNTGKSVSICLSAAFPIESRSIHRRAENTIAEAEAMAERLNRLLVFSPEQIMQNYNPHAAFSDCISRLNREIMAEVDSVF